MQGIKVEFCCESVALSLCRLHNASQSSSESLKSRPAYDVYYRRATSISYSYPLPLSLAASLPFFFFRMSSFIFFSMCPSFLFFSTLSFFRWATALRCFFFRQLFIFPNCEKTMDYSLTFIGLVCGLGHPATRLL